MLKIIRNLLGTGTVSFRLELVFFLKLYNIVLMRITSSISFVFDLRLLVLMFDLRSSCLAHCFVGLSSLFKARMGKLISSKRCKCSYLSCFKQLIQMMDLICD